MTRMVAWPTWDGPTVKRMVVVEVAFLRGKGNDESDPVRRVARYYDAETDELLWEYDPTAARSAVSDPDADFDPRRTSRW